MLAKFLIPAFMAAGALAAPLEARAIDVVDVVDTVYLTVTEGNIPPQATPAPDTGAGFLQPGANYGPPPPPPVPTPVYTPPPPPPPPAPSSVAPAPQVASPAPAPSGSSGNSPTSGGVPIIDTVNEFRQAYSLNNLEWDDGLASQALTVGNDGGGVTEAHQLIPNLDMGQVITPGQQVAAPTDQPFSPFKTAYIAWLCEVPSDSQLQASANGGVALCSVMQDILHMVYSDTGHHDIIVSSTWNKVGCAFAGNPASNDQSTYQGLWVCNYST